jgi:succinate-semialdehyde dehydrogenase/glutarate-semialdehyde dehydrogenase
VINAPARQKMLSLVEEAAGHGARVLTGGKAPDRPGFFVPPTVLSEVPANEHILKEEIFGPIAPIVTFRDVNEAIEFANQTDRGLAAYVYTRDLAKGLAIAEAIESGMVGLNRGFISDPAAPFGGVKQSGLGREGAHEGLLEFLETKYIATTW